MGRFHYSDGCTHPGSQLILYFFICPVAYDHLALNSHTGHNMSIFSSAVGRLVFIHEIHINGLIRDLLVKLGMQMA